MQRSKRLTKGNANQLLQYGKYYGWQVLWVASKKTLLFNINILVSAVILRIF